MLEHEILLDIIKDPTVIKYYKDLYKVYESKAMLHEAAAISHLIEKRTNEINRNSNPGKE